jgi:hypothetical protein
MLPTEESRVIGGYTMTVHVTPAEVPAPLPLQEALRVVGQTLEVQQVSRIQLTVGAHGVVVGTTTDYTYRQYSWTDLRVHSDTQARFRRPAGRTTFWDPTDLTRWSVLLRVTGSLLDARGIAECTIRAAVGETPAACQLAVHAEGQLVLDRAAIQDFVLWARLRRGAQAALDAAALSETERGTPCVAS